MSKTYHRILQKPYYAVIFSSQRNGEDIKGYEKAAEQMVELAEKQIGYIGLESVRDYAGYGITVSFWESLDAIKAWKEQMDHQEAQANGRDKWYSGFEMKIVEVDRTYGFLAG